MKSYRQRQISRGINLYKLMICGIKTTENKEYLNESKVLKNENKKVIVRKPKKGLSNQEKEVKELLSILDGKEKATVKLDKVLKRLK